MTLRPDLFDALDEAACTHLLLTCLHSRTWASRVAAGRPYGDQMALEAAATTAARDLDDAGLAEALSAHPRIGERASAPGVAAEQSGREQAAVTRATHEDPSLVAALRQANLDYEARFGHVFLIRAAGRDAAEILAAARDRLGNDPAREAAVVREQLGEIAVLRLRAGLADLAG